MMLLPKLAARIGLHEAILLSQMHYWLIKPSAHERDGRRWIWNSYRAWADQMTFFTPRQVEIAIKSLEAQNLIFIGNYNRMAYDRTHWYAINYDAVAALGIQVRERVT